MQLTTWLFIWSIVSCAWAANYTLDDCPLNVRQETNIYLAVFGSSCYSFLLSEEREFDAAESACESRHGYLTTIKNAATQQFLYHTVHDTLQYGGVVWLGLNDRDTEGQYRWVDGTLPHYTHWASGQPGILGGVEDCAGMDMSDGGQWNDYRCEEFFFFSSEHVFVCEYPLGVTTTAATSTTASTTPSTILSSALGVTTTILSSGNCGVFVCSLDCGPAGYKQDDNNCQVCECETTV